MAVVAKQIVDDALDHEQLGLPSCSRIGSLYLTADRPGCNWGVRYEAGSDQVDAQVRRMISDLQDRYPLINPFDFFCQTV
jgi:hypothetical protein